MADTIIGALRETLTSLIQQEFTLLLGVKEDMEKLSTTLSVVRTVLEDAEKKQIAEKPVRDWLEKLKLAAYDAIDALDEWELQAQEELLHTESTTQVSCCFLPSKVSSFFSCFTIEQTVFRRNIALRVKNIINNFDEIATERQKFHLSQNVVPTGSQFLNNRETISIPTEPKIYGRDADQKNIIDILLSNASLEQDISICPIVGIGGLGKTTLAQLVYNEERVVKTFELRVWVCVSEPFDIKEILKSIIESCTGDACALQTLQIIQSKVREVLSGKKYLFVLDDVWTENRDDWNKLKSILNGGANGSSIIVTTRLGTVASITGTVPSYHLEGLTDEDCWSLFKDRAFAVGSEEHPNLVAIGKDIMKRCKGVPLAAKSLGSLLWLKTEESQWKLIRDNEIWNLEDVENGILPALRLSYIHLPPHLRQCFTYCSVFPKDHVMKKDKLICLWIANGFIQSNKNMEVEEIGDEIFMELLRRSFFQDVKKDYFYYGYTTTCKMHDLMHDLANSVVANECLITQFDEAKDVRKTIRHLSIVPDSSHSPSGVFEASEKSSHPDLTISSSPSLRTLFFFDSINFDSFRFSSTLRALDLSFKGMFDWPQSICHLKSLRYLDLSHNYIGDIPESIGELRNLEMLDLSNNGWYPAITLPLSIGNLENLRYLNLRLTAVPSLPESMKRCRNLRMLELSDNAKITLPPWIGNLQNLRHLCLYYCTGIISLPESLGGLKNLESLTLNGCRRLQELPVTMKNLSSLRHLTMDGFRSLKKLPVGIGQLTHIQTLDFFTVGRFETEAGIQELQGLNQLRGSLWINGLQNVEDVEDAKKANLSRKLHLSGLCLSWFADSDSDEDDGFDEDDGADGFDGGDYGNCKEVMEGLQLPPNTEELYIGGYRAPCYPEGLLQNLNCLRSLTVSRSSLPNELEKCTSLRTVTFYNCSSLKCLPVLGSSLVELVITECKNLTSVSDGLLYLTSLQRLEIRECPELIWGKKDFLHLTSLQTLNLNGIDREIANLQHDLEEMENER